MPAAPAAPAAAPAPAVAALAELFDRLTLYELRPVTGDELLNVTRFDVLTGSAKRHYGCVSITDDLIVGERKIIIITDSYTLIAVRQLPLDRSELPSRAHRHHDYLGAHPFTQVTRDVYPFTPAQRRWLQAASYTLRSGKVAALPVLPGVP